MYDVFVPQETRILWQSYKERSIKLVKTIKNLLKFQTTQTQFDMLTSKFYIDHT